MSNLDLVSRVNADYVEDQYRRYREDPSSVDEGWALFLRCLVPKVRYCPNWAKL